LVEASKVVILVMEFDSPPHPNFKGKINADHPGYYKDSNNQSESQEKGSTGLYPEHKTSD